MVGVCAAISVALSLGLVSTSSADTGGDKRKVDASIAELSSAIEGTSADLAKAVVGLRRITAVLPGVRQALVVADVTRVAADRRNQTLATALAVAQANAAKATEALRTNARESQAVADQLGNLVRNDYQHGAVSGLSIALEATSPEDFTDRLVLLDTVMQVRRATLRGLDAQRAQGLAGESHLQAVGRRVAALKAEGEAALARAATARQTASSAKSKLDLLYAAQAEFEATLAARKAIEIIDAWSGTLWDFEGKRCKVARRLDGRRAL